MSLPKFIYLDAQASLPILSHSHQAMLREISEAHANPHSSDHTLGLIASARLQRFKSSFACQFGVSSGEVIFTSGATEANNIAINHMFAAVEGGATVAVLGIDHASSINALNFFGDKYNGKKIILPVDEFGQVNFQSLSEAISQGLSGLSINLANGEIGSIQDLSRISELCRKNSVFFHIDCAQAMYESNIQEFAALADCFSISSHKIGGPVGVGALVISGNAINSFTPFVVGGGQQLGIRDGTLSTMLISGFSAALEYQRSHNGEIVEALRNLSTSFIDTLKKRGVKFKLNGANTKRHAGNLNICFENIDADQLLRATHNKICASTGSACSSQSIEPSHVLIGIGLSDKEAKSSLRFSFDFRQAPREVQDAANLVADAINIQID